MGQCSEGSRYLVSAVELRDVLSQATSLLFDFDGPLCDVFAGRNAGDVARHLQSGWDVETSSDDPIEVVRIAYERLPAATAAQVEDALISEECEAISVCKPEFNGLKAVKAAQSLNMDIAIVSNNSAQSIEKFINARHSALEVNAISGRPFRRVDLMKPDPYSLLRAMDAVESAPPTAAFVGDSLTDIEAARRAGVPCIALANKPGKRAAFETAGAHVVIDEMAELASALQQLTR